jgi:hypothetical protein
VNLQPKNYDFIAAAGQQLGQGVEKTISAVDKAKQLKLNKNQLDQIHQDYTQQLAQKYDEATGGGDPVKKRVWLEKYFPPPFEGEDPVQTVDRWEKAEKGAMADLEQQKVQKFKTEATKQPQPVQQQPVGQVEVDQQKGLEGQQIPQNTSAKDLSAFPQNFQQLQDDTLATHQAPQAMDRPAPYAAGMQRTAEQMNIEGNKDVAGMIDRKRGSEAGEAYQPGQTASSYLAGQAADQGTITPAAEAVGTAMLGEEKIKKPAMAGGTEPFEQGTQEYEFARRMVGLDENGKKTKPTLPYTQAMQLYSAMGGSIANRPRLLSTAYVLDPNYDAQGSITTAKGQMAHAAKAGTLSSDIIEKEANKAHAIARAKLTPDVTSPTVDKMARANTAKTLNNQRAATQRALSTFEDAKNKTKGTYENIPDWMYRDLASDYAKILVSTGQIAEGSVDKVMQKSAKGSIVGLWNMATGDTKTTAPEKVLRLMHDRIKKLGTDLDKQYYNQVQGTNIPINSDQSTNPMATSEDSPHATPKNQAEYDALPPGSTYIDSDGTTIKRKK